MVNEIAKINDMLNNGIDAVIFSGSKPDKIAFLERVIPALRQGGFVLTGSSASYALNGELAALRDRIRGGDPDRLLTAVDYLFDPENPRNAVDIGERTIALYLARLDTLRAGQTILLNGTQGHMERGFTKGNDAILAKVRELAARGAKVVVVGGDASDYARAAGLNEEPNTTFFTGAQVPFAILSGEKLVGLEALRTAL